MKRGGLLRTWSRPSQDRVTQELADALYERDLGCVLSFLEPGHACTDRWGYVIEWDDRRGLSVEHVHAELMMGRRAPSDMAHCVVLCAGSNIAVPSKAERALMREYLRARAVA